MPRELGETRSHGHAARARRLVACVGALTLLVFACTSDDDSATSTTTAGQTATTREPTAAIDVELARFAQGTCTFFDTVGTDDEAADENVSIVTAAGVIDDPVFEAAFAEACPQYVDLWEAAKARADHGGPSNTATTLDRTSTTVLRPMTTEAPVIVAYEILGSGNAQATYASGSGQSQEEVSLPWRRELSGSDLPQIPALSAQLHGAGSISCRIARQGEVIAEDTSAGEYAIVSCQ